MTSTPPLRLKSSGKNLKQQAGGKTQAVPPPIQTSLPLPQDINAPPPPQVTQVPPMSPTSRGKLRPTATGSSAKTGSSSGSGANSGNKLFNTISTSVKNLSSQPAGTRTNEIIRTVSGHAKHYQDKDIETKLRLLVSSTFKFDELIEFGFPIQLTAADISLVEGNGYEAKQETPLPEASDLSAPSAQQLERIRESMDVPPRKGSITGSGDNFEDEGARYRMSMAALASPMSAVPREMTLKFTLTPPSMRADEAILYGWQKNLVASEEALEELDDDETAPPVQPPQQPEMQMQGSDASSGIPVGGFGKDTAGAGSKTMMKRVFGKLKKAPKPAGTSVMITSADMN